MSARYYSFVESRYGWSEEEIFDRRQNAYYRDQSVEEQNRRVSALLLHPLSAFCTRCVTVERAAYPFGLHNWPDLA